MPRGLCLSFPVCLGLAHVVSVRSSLSLSNWDICGGRQTGEFRGVEYAYKALNIYDDHNQPVYADHPHFAGLVYWDKHKQPTSDPCLPALLKKYYGSINAINTIQNIAAEFQTGNARTCSVHSLPLLMLSLPPARTLNTHILCWCAEVAVYDFGQDLVYVANPRADGESGPVSVPLSSTCVFPHSTLPPPLSP